jgi:hypothetical protein
LGEFEMYCWKCGRAVDEGNAFCPHCGAQIGGSPVAPVAPQVEKYTPAAKKKPRIGFALSLIGGVLTFLSGVGYLIVGNPVAGLLGVIFGILIVVCSRRLFAATDVRKVGIFGAIPFFLGWVVLIASGTVLPFDPVVSLAGFLTVVGSVGLLAGR